MYFYACFYAVRSGLYCCCLLCIKGLHACLDRHDRHDRHCKVTWVQGGILLLRESLYQNCHPISFLKSTGTWQMHRQSAQPRPRLHRKQHPHKVTNLSCPFHQLTVIAQASTIKCDFFRAKSVAHHESKFFNYHLTNKKQKQNNNKGCVPGDVGQRTTDFMAHIDPSIVQTKEGAGHVRNLMIDEREEPAKAGTDKWINVEV